MRRRRFLTSMAGFGALAMACDGPKPSPTPSATAAPATASPTPARTATPTSSPAPRPVAALEPRGFPIDPATRCGLVTGQVGARRIEWGAGPTAEAYSRGDQASDDPERANRCGWNARTHVEYEGQPAVDWYIEAGTPVRATMDGVATLIVYTTANPFEVYGVSREAYLGNPDRARAPLSPFPGPGGGQGVAVHIEDAEFRSDYAHLDVARTIPLVPAGAFLAGYSARTNHLEAFAALRPFGVGDEVARWPVHRGDVIGYSGDSGYSEAPHLHYTITRQATRARLCPTAEPGFAGGGWLLLR